MHVKSKVFLCVASVLLLAGCEQRVDLWEIRAAASTCGQLNSSIEYLLVSHGKGVVRCSDGKLYRYAEPTSN